MTGQQSMLSFVQNRVVPATGKVRLLYNLKNHCSWRYLLAYRGKKPVCAESHKSVLVSRIDRQRVAMLRNIKAISPYFSLGYNFGLFHLLDPNLN